MGVKESSVVVFAEKELHTFYKAFAAGLDSSEVLTCQDGPDWILSRRAELVFLDCGFRTRRGLEFLRQIKKANPRTIVVIINEKSSEETVIEALHSGARYYLRKPVAMSRLRLISKSLLKLKSRTKEERLPHIDGAGEHNPTPGDVLTGKPANLIRAVHFIEENLGTHLDLETLAMEAHLSKYQFCRVFKRHFGMSPMEFVTSMRVSRAQELLRRDDLNITEVALYVGFKDHGNFIRAFKKRMGVLPSKFRSSLKAAVAG
jgi:AraC-like DNA-binding protein